MQRALKLYLYRYGHINIDLYKYISPHQNSSFLAKEAKKSGVILDIQKTFSGHKPRKRLSHPEDAQAKPSLLGRPQRSGTPVTKGWQRLSVSEERGSGT